MDAIIALHGMVLVLCRRLSYRYCVKGELIILLGNKQNQNMEHLLIALAFPPLAKKAATSSSSTDTVLLEKCRKSSQVCSDKRHRTPRTIDGLLSAQQVVDPFSSHNILDEIKRIERDAGTQLQVVVVDDIDYNSCNPKQFATMLFNDWQIEPANKNNGVSVFVVLNQRRVEIEIGSGLNNYMGSEWCTNLLTEEAVPRFKVDQYGQGIYNTVVGVANRLREVDTGLAQPSTSGMMTLEEKVGFGV